MQVVKLLPYKYFFFQLEDRQITMGFIKFYKEAFSSLYVNSLFS